jgi:hypothetical protein
MYDRVRIGRSLDCMKSKSRIVRWITVHTPPALGQSPICVLKEHAARKFTIVQCNLYIMPRFFGDAKYPVGKEMTCFKKRASYYLANP